LKARHGTESIHVEIAPDYATVSRAEQTIRWPSGKGLANSFTA
jgi:hypothetical protein